MAQIIWHKRAVKQLESLQTYLSEEFGHNTTAQFTLRLFQFLDLLQQYPDIGSMEHPERGIRGFLLHRHTKIFYKLKREKLFILSLFDIRQHPDKRF